MKHKKKESHKKHRGETAANDNNFSDIIKSTECIKAKDGAPYVIADDRCKKLYLLSSNECRDWLTDIYYKKYKSLPSQHLLQNTINILKHRAGSKSKTVFNRIGINEKKSAVYIDLCDNNNKFVKITSDNIKDLSRLSIYFRRSNASQPLEFTHVKNSISIIKNFMNSVNTNNRGKKLIIAWLLSALNPRGPYPILVLQGEQGSGKSTFARMLKMLIDPSSAPLRSLFKTERDLVISARHNWVLAFDNVSYIKPDMSDALCRLSTGGGFSTRKMYSDSDEVIFDVTRPVIINGIANIIPKNDFADRALVVNMKSIRDEKRKTEEDIWKNFNASKSFVLGALVKGVQTALKNKDKIKLDRSVRLADSLKWIVAAEPAIFKKTGKFIKAYESNRRNISFLCIESDPVATAIKGLMNTKKSKWEGRANDLLNDLRKQLPQEHEEQITNSKAWPKAANSLSRRIKEIAPLLRNFGINVKSKKTSVERLLVIKKSMERNPLKKDKG